MTTRKESIRFFVRNLLGDVQVEPPSLLHFFHFSWPFGSPNSPAPAANPSSDRAADEAQMRAWRELSSCKALWMGSSRWSLFAESHGNDIDSMFG